MRFALIRKADPDTEAGKLASQDLYDVMVAYQTKERPDVRFVDGFGLRPSSQGVRLTFSNGSPAVVDGPFAETKELVAGVSLIEATSLEAVIAVARDWPREDGDVELEIRPLWEMDDLIEPASA
ncbi:YciI family protein [Brevundimonas sp.]|uniref:YciI family protein n=1 Tax=Brevundimonas sp. TaxID=1871086 RepID=UPI002D304605|nr:YciI family protein [Brevundimonas sp.]HYD27891.1 YciI family protein [Brevundimonas sp.]